ncbi:MAG TPA: hypothetical protein PLM33_06415 [Acidobacteriota bacterium]|nr:hypothetical protein [Acidobacteriota bacterium]
MKCITPCLSFVKQTVFLAWCWHLIPQRLVELIFRVLPLCEA